MFTKADFQSAIENTLDAYPAIAALYQAKDPRILQHLEAMATMLAMLSAQIEVAQAEVFEKSRDSTILADAAMRGIVPKARAARVQLSVHNSGEASFHISAGTKLLDAQGRAWETENSANIEAGQSLQIQAIQRWSKKIRHIVQNSTAFYAIEVPQADNGDHLQSMAISDMDGDFAFRDRYVNIGANEKTFHVEADESQRIFVRFGIENVVGWQPRNGDILNLNIWYTAGIVHVNQDAPFYFEYLTSPAQSKIEITMQSMIEEGGTPFSMDVLRQIAKYPSVYDNNAVFLGEFDYLIRRNFGDLQFLSVWNEAKEERARGANIENINTIFIACMSSAGTELSKEQNTGEDNITPNKIEASALTETQKAIAKKVLEADDSYKVQFYTPILAKIQAQVTANVGNAHQADIIKKQIQTVLLDEFGKNSFFSKKGGQRLTLQRIYTLLRKKIAALAELGADMHVQITEPQNWSNLPEMWRFISKDSLDVQVHTDVSNSVAWGL